VTHFFGLLIYLGFLFALKIRQVITFELLEVWYLT